MKRIVLILLCLILSVGCFPCFSEASPNNAGISKTPWHDPVWDSLYKRLLKDGFSQKQLDKYFVQLENGFSQKPMGNKVKELYTASFVPKKKPVKEKGKEKPKTNKLGIPYPWYDGYVTDANAVKCLNFLKENEEYFALAEKKYAVPREVISALSYVET